MSEAFAAFLGAVIGSGLLLFRDWFASALDTRKRAKYLAIRVVTILDRFVDQCAVVSIDDGNLEGWRDERTVTTDAPAPVIFPADVDWRSIDHLLAYDLLALDNNIHDAKQAISATSEFSSPPDHEEYYEARRYHHALLGIEAARLARTLRDTHDLPRRTFGEWNPETKLHETQAEIAAERKRQKDSQSDLF